MSIRNYLLVITSPRHWLRVRNTSKALGDFISKSLDDGATPIIVDEYTMKLNGITLWRENYPYGYGNIYDGKTPNLLPPRHVCIALRKAELAATEGVEEKQIADALSRARGES